MVELDPIHSKSITGSDSNHAVDTFNVHLRPKGVVLKLAKRPLLPGFRVLYRVKKQGEMRLSEDYYTADPERARITLNWDFDLDCQFIVEYSYGSA
jgi:hypothetical protein